jgi:allantoinase
VVGADADLALVALQDEAILQASDLYYHHQHSPYVGRKLHGRVTRTLLRGVTIYRDGQIVSDPIGRLITPTSD